MSWETKEDKKLEQDISRHLQKKYGMTKQAADAYAKAAVARNEFEKTRDRFKF